jgi:putative ABC transport system ATP-binding protein
MLNIVALVKTFPGAEGEIRAVDGVTLSLMPGEILAVQGPSGSGKSTLLNLIAGLDAPTSGEIEFRGERVSGASQERLAALRRTDIAVIFQAHNLFEELTAAENIRLVLQMRGESRGKAAEVAQDALAVVGLAECASRFPHQLSGGQRQRVGIARAMASRASLILCDEPTASLDSANVLRFAEVLQLAAAAGAAAIIATHDDLLATTADRSYRMLDGCLTPLGVSVA